MILVQLLGPSWTITSLEETDEREGTSIWRNHFYNVDLDLPFVADDGHLRLLRSRIRETGSTHGDRSESVETKRNARRQVDAGPGREHVSSNLARTGPFVLGIPKEE